MVQFMNIRVRLGLFTAALLLLFGAGFVVGRAVGPVSAEAPAPAHSASSSSSPQGAHS